MEDFVEIDDILYGDDRANDPWNSSSDDEADSEHVSDCELHPSAMLASSTPQTAATSSASFSGDSSIPLERSRED